RPGSGKGGRPRAWSGWRATRMGLAGSPRGAPRFSPGCATVAGLWSRSRPQTRKGRAGAAAPRRRAGGKRPPCSAPPDPKRLLGRRRVGAPGALGADVEDVAAKAKALVELGRGAGPVFGEGRRLAGQLALEAVGAGAGGGEAEARPAALRAHLRLRDLGVGRRELGEARGHRLVGVELNLARPRPRAAPAGPAGEDRARSGLRGQGHLGSLVELGRAGRPAVDAGRRARDRALARALLLDRERPQGDEARGHRLVGVERDLAAPGPRAPPARPARKRGARGGVRGERDLGSVRELRRTLGAAVDPPGRARDRPLA